MQTASPDSASLVPILSTNLDCVRARIERACRAAGRDPQTVRLLAVTKYVGAPVIEALAGLGVGHVGENYVVPALAKMAEVQAPLTWQLIGHLQRNKAGKVVGAFDEVDTLDNPALARRLDSLARERAVVLPVLIQVKTTGEAAKTGVAPEALDDLLEVVDGSDGLAFEGLLTMAGTGDDEAATRRRFDGLRRTRDALAERLGRPLRLSMGMSRDLEVAVACGATEVRVGSALYAGLPDGPEA